MCKAFLEAGIHVACDKPLATDSSQAEDLKRIADEKGLLFMVTYTYMGHVTAKYVRDLVKNGEIGPVRTVMAEYPQGWLYNEKDWGGKQGEWRCDPKQSGRVNCLGDLGTHVAVSYTHLDVYKRQTHALLWPSTYPEMKKKNITNHVGASSPAWFVIFYKT